MGDFQITCINKQPRDNSYEGITHLGGPNNGNGMRWIEPRANIISYIQQGIHSFYTLVNGRRSNVGVINGTYGPYVRAYADGVWNDNLLALNECVL
jgi:hypothetical protein